MGRPWFAHGKRREKGLKKNTVRPSRRTGCCPRIFLTKKATAILWSIPANVLSLCPEGLYRGAERTESLPAPCRGRDVSEAEADVITDLRFLTHLPPSSFFRVTGPWFAQRPHTTVPAAVTAALVPGVASAEPHLHPALLGVPVSIPPVPGVGTETLIVPQPPTGQAFHAGSQAQLE